MKKLNLLVLAILFSSSMLFIPSAKAQEEDFDTTNVASIEEEVTLKELDLTEEDVESDNSFFGRLKNRLRLWNPSEEKRIKARERLANIKLWQAKKFMAQDDENIKKKGIRALELYKKHQAKINDRLEKFTEKKKEKFKSLIERVEKKRIRHLKVLGKVQEKYPQKKIKFIEDLRENNAKKIEKRFKTLPDIDKEKYLEHFKKKVHLSNIQMLERLNKDAPEKFKKKIKSITDDHALRLKKRIKNVKNIKEVEKFERKFKKKRPDFLEVIEERRILKKKPVPGIDIVPKVNKVTN